MLNDYQSAILAEMGITQFVDQSQADKDTSSLDNVNQVTSESTTQASQSDARSKIASLRDSLGAQKDSKSQPSVEQVTVNHQDSPCVKDIAIALDHLGLKTIPIDKWQVQSGKNPVLTSEHIVFSEQPAAMSWQQKKALWQVIVNAYEQQ